MAKQRTILGSSSLQGPPTLLSPAQLQRFRKSLLSWYQKHHRTLPWRGSPTPYGVWVSEVMLQQTRVEVVRDYYARWMDRFPSLEALAKAEESEVLRLWQGLGYYSRARRLRQGARYVVDNFGGALPQAPVDLLKIPGIGPYSAGAISSIAFGLPSAIVDGNVVRVLARHFALSGDPNKRPLKELLWSLAAQLVPPQDPGSFNQALMELGAILCTPKKPQCHSCPLRKSCLALEQGLVAVLPDLPKPKQKTEMTLVVLVLIKPSSNGGASEYGFINLGEEAKWWAQMDVFPFKELGQDQDPVGEARKMASDYVRLGPASALTLDPISHTVTRFALRLVPVILRVKASTLPRGGLTWAGDSELARLALPSAYKKVLLQAKRFRSQ